MINKFSAILGSRRFWILTVAGFVWIASRLAWIPDEVAIPIIAWLTNVAGVGTIDKLGNK